MLQIEPLFSGGKDPLPSVPAGLREVKLQGKGRNVTITAPLAWSDTACTVFASHYLREVKGVQETSVLQAIDRLASTTATWASTDGYMSAETAETFRHELAAMLVFQMWSPNSPAWYNIGVTEHPQLSACFLQSVEDSMESLITLQNAQTRLFQRGSGTGTNYSTLRPEDEPLSGGGTASGPNSFLKAFDTWGGVTKSGGKTRRSASMMVLNIDHPDVMGFIRSKADIERMAWDLVDAGHPSDYNGPVFANLMHQNANHSVSVTDDFMCAVEQDQVWALRWNGEVKRSLRARELWDAICDACWTCGDPGMHYRDTMNTWHTSPSGGKIGTTNPCSEFVFIDDSACNLASLNLRKFWGVGAHPNGQAAFAHAVRLSIIAQEIYVDRAEYPTKKIAHNSFLYRPLGLGFSNLGALLLSLGLPYDSEDARLLAGAITSFMCAKAYETSQELTLVKGDSFAQSQEDGRSMMRVLDMHTAAARRLDEQLQCKQSGYIAQIGLAALDTWLGVSSSEVLPRNGQVSLLAPAGTISFIMDCDTTGIEPDFAVVKYKGLAGGGMLKLVNNSVAPALETLGYTPEQAQDITAYVLEKEKIEGAPWLRSEHLPVFDCANRCALTTSEPGERYISPSAHLLMMAAVQPFLSGAISKSVNVPHETTPAQISDLYMQAWKFGLKAVAIYRDGCKASQPLAGVTQERLNHDHPHVIKTRAAIAKALFMPGKDEVPTLDDILGQIRALQALVVQTPAPAPKPVRRKLPQTRAGWCHKFSVGGHEGYLHVGCHEDGTLGEVFLRMAKEGSSVSGLLDGWATNFSIALQYGAPLEVLCEKGMGTRFDPSGFTGDALRSASSILDYVCRYLHSIFVSKSQTRPELSGASVIHGEDSPSGEVFFTTHALSALKVQIEPIGKVSGRLNPCPVPGCDGDLQRAGACEVCSACGTTSGCG